MKIRQVAGFAILTAAMSGAAFASTKSSEPVKGESVTVSFADLDINAPAGVAALQHRIKAAAEQVCGANEGKVALRQQVERRACVAESISNSMTAVDYNDNHMVMVTVHRS